MIGLAISRINSDNSSSSASRSKEKVIMKPRNDAGDTNTTFDKNDLT